MAFLLVVGFKKLNLYLLRESNDSAQRRLQSKGVFLCHEFVFKIVLFDFLKIQSFQSFYLSPKGN